MYKILKKLGRGSFADVYLLHMSNGDKFALKVADTNRLVSHGQKYGELTTEAELMQRLCHNHLVQCCSYFLKGRYLYLITELCDNGTLTTYLNKFSKPVPEPQVLTWLSQMADALRYLHACNVIHRDLKPDNIFLDQRSNIKIGDLGIARELAYTLEKAQTFIGTYLYMSPEILESSVYTTKTDVWSLGCCIHEVMTRHKTFMANSVQKLMEKVIKEKIPPMPKSYSKDLQSLVLTILDRNPNTRPDALEILVLVCQIQGHPYKSESHEPLEMVAINENLVCKAVERYEYRQLTDTDASNHKNDDDDDDVVVISSRKPSKAEKFKSPPSVQSKVVNQISRQTKIKPDRRSETGKQLAKHESETIPPSSVQKSNFEDEAFPTVMSGNMSNSSSTSSTYFNESKNHTLVNTSQIQIQSSSSETAGVSSQASTLSGMIVQSSIYESRTHQSQSSLLSGIDQTYMDKLGTECRQWLRSRFAPESEEDKPRQHRRSELDSSSDSESLVTLYTRAQKVKYINKKSKSRTSQSGTDICDLESEILPDVLEAAQNVIHLFKHEDSDMEAMLIHVMGFRDFTVHGQELMNRILQD